MGVDPLFDFNVTAPVEGRITIGNWVWTMLGSPSLQTLSPTIVGGTATFPFSTSGLIGAGEFKFRVVSWTTDGEYSVATAYENW